MTRRLARGDDRNVSGRASDEGSAVKASDVVQANVGYPEILASGIPDSESLRCRLRHERE